MKIAIFSDTILPQVNGVAVQVNFLATLLSESGHEVMVFAPAKKNGSFERQYKFINLPSLPALIYPEIRFALPNINFYRQLKKFNPDIIHSHTPFLAGFEAIIAAKLLKKPLVGTHHTFYDYYLKHIRLDFKLVERFTNGYVSFYYNFCDLVFGPTKISIEKFSQYGIKRPMEVLPNTIDTDFFCPTSGTEKNKIKRKFSLKNKSIVCLGRLSYEKSIGVLVRAFAKVLSQRPETGLVLIGDGPEKKNLTKLTSQLGIEKNVKFTGFLFGKDLVEMLNANDIFVTASKTETFGIAVLEGMASGLPVVAVSEKSFLELIDDSINGYLVPADNEGEMARKIIMLLDNNSLREGFASSAREKAMDYSKDKVLKRICSFYLKLISQKNG